MKYAAFLRAINVGGRVVKMDRLRTLFEAAGLRGVETFIASGNVVFESGRKNTGDLERASFSMSCRILPIGGDCPTRL